MPRKRNHEYRVSTRWTGNLGSGTSAYTAYSRDHESTAPGKAQAIAGSSDPAFRGSAVRYCPEELLVAAVANCHMLWVLHLCSDAGIVVTEHLDGSGEMTRVILRPRLRITDASRAGDLPAIHARAHQVCCLARSVRFAVTHEADVVV